MPLELDEFAKRYAKAWCSQNPEDVAAFFAEKGSLSVNGDAPAVGGAAITEVARGFMTAFPDMVVEMDGIAGDAAAAVYRWTLSGTNDGPGGTGRAVHIRGREEWTIGSSGLIARSLGRFDEAEYRRQLDGGPALGSPTGEAD